MCSCSEAPPEDRARVAESGADLVDEFAREQEANRISKLKGTADFSVEDVVDQNLFADFRQQDAEDNSIKVVDRSPEKEQR